MKLRRVTETPVWFTLENLAGVVGIVFCLLIIPVWWGVMWFQTRLVKSNPR